MHLMTWERWGMQNIDSSSGMGVVWDMVKQQFSIAKNVKRKERRGSVA